jgi:hypothetical protein
MEQHCLTTPLPQFDKKYKVIVRTKYSTDYFEKLTWVNSNSVGSVDVVNITASGMNTQWTDVYFAFEDPSDATFFKIKYSL